MQCTSISVLNHLHQVSYFLSHITEDVVTVLTFASGWLKVWSFGSLRCDVLHGIFPTVSCL